MSNKHYRGIKAVRQEDRDSCWAACLEWWLKAVENRPKMEQWEVLIEYEDYCNADGQLSKLGMYNIINDSRWLMEGRCYVGFQAKYEVFKEHINRGPIFCGFKERSTARKHVNVIYSVYEWKGTQKVRVMEPDGGIHIRRRLDYYNYGVNDLWLGSPKP